MFNNNDKSRHFGIFYLDYTIDDIPPVAKYVANNM